MELHAMQYENFTAQDVPKTIQVEGYSIDKTGNKTKELLSIETNTLSPHDFANIFLLQSFPKYLNPVCLDNDELFGETRRLCYRVLCEMTENAIALQQSEKSEFEGRFIPAAYDRMCFALLKLRDCIDEMRNRDLMDRGITAAWDVSEMAEIEAMFKHINELHE